VVDGLVCLFFIAVVCSFNHLKKQTKAKHNQHKHTPHTIKTEQMRAQKEDDLQTL
jgi:hypothetical protein